MINAEQQIEIMDKLYPKQIKADIVELILEKDVVTNEVQSMRKMTRTFKQTEEKSNKLIQELKTRYEMVREEKEQKEIEFDKRLNTLIRDFVKIYKKLGDDFGKYKDYIKLEIECLNQCLEKKQRVINQLEENVGEYKEALRIPRQHYKFIEKLKFEEIKQQRDEIIQKMQRKHNCTREEALKMFVMPDPTLPPEQQMEIVTGGKLVEPTKDNQIGGIG